MRSSGILLLGLWLTFAAPAQAEPGALPIGKLEMAYPYPSPDGTQLVFQGNFDGRWQLYITDLETGHIRRAHRSNGDDMQPAWSPDGKTIAFISNRDGNDELYLLNVAIGMARPLAPHPGKDGHPKWSADGRSIVFNRTLDPRDTDGDRDAAIMTVDARGFGTETLSDTDNIETFPSLSPDGSKVAFVEWIKSDNSDPAGDIVIVDIASGERQNLTHSPAFDAYPIWGPRGDWIYYSTFETTPTGEEANIFRIRSDGTVRQRITQIDGISESRAVPTADEARLFYNSVTNGNIMIYHRDLYTG